MATPGDILEFLANEIRARLANHTYFSDIPIFSQYDELHAEKVETALGPAIEKTSKAGIALIVGKPFPVPVSGEAPGPVNRVIFPVRIEEDALVNREATYGTGKTHLAAACRTMGVIHHFTPHNYSGTIIADGFEPFFRRDSRFGVDLQFTTDIGISIEDKCVEPDITVTALRPEITLLNAQADSGGSLAGTYFDLYDQNGAVRVWANNNGTASAPSTPAGGRLLPVEFDDDSAAATIASASQSSLDADDEFSAELATSVVVRVTDTVSGVRTDVDNTGAFLQGVAPQQQGANATITLTTSTSGAAIYYTEDSDNPPEIGATGTTLYSTPLTGKLPGATYRAAAFDQGTLRQSDIAYGVIPDNLPPTV